jgi:hypothetical protein
MKIVKKILVALMLIIPLAAQADHKRGCALDRMEGFWRFYYGGVFGSPTGRVGTCKFRINEVGGISSVGQCLFAASVRGRLVGSFEPAASEACGYSMELRNGEGDVIKVSFTTDDESDLMIGKAKLISKLDDTTNVRTKGRQVMFNGMRIPTAE